MKTVKELFRNTSLEEVIPILSAEYDEGPEIIQGYKDHWQKWVDLPSLPSSLICVVTKTPDRFAQEGDEDYGKAYGDVSGVAADEFGKEGAIWYAIEFMPWEMWMNMPVHRDPSDMSDAEALAHILYEMTWGGFNQSEIQERHEEIVDSVKDAMEQFGD